MLAGVLELPACLRIPRAHMQILTPGPYPRDPDPGDPRGGLQRALWDSSYRGRPVPALLWQMRKRNPEGNACGPGLWSPSLPFPTRAWGGSSCVWEQCCPPGLNEAAEAAWVPGTRPGPPETCTDGAPCRSWGQARTRNTVTGLETGVNQALRAVRLETRPQPGARPIA